MRKRLAEAESQEQGLLKNNKTTNVESWKGGLI
jgi:hypothetical protein